MKKSTAATLSLSIAPAKSPRNGTVSKANFKEQKKI